jgi:hypothetical protein
MVAYALELSGVLTINVSGAKPPNRTRVRHRSGLMRPCRSLSTSTPMTPSPTVRRDKIRNHAADEMAEKRGGDFNISFLLEKSGRDARLGP